MQPVARHAERAREHASVSLFGAIPENASPVAVQVTSHSQSTTRSDWPNESARDEGPRKATCGAGAGCGDSVAQPTIASAKTVHRQTP